MVEIEKNINAARANQIEVDEADFVLLKNLTMKTIAAKVCNVENRIEKKPYP